MHREFDIVVFGASGFSGKLIAEYLVEKYGDDVRIALAGRNEAKLNALRESLGVALPVLIGDSADLPAMRSIAGRTRLVVSCAGPFLLYGSNMVQACAEAGTDYVDVTGEVYWSSQMIAAHDNAAKESGARIVSFCGFDSVPSDIGVYLLQRRAKEARGKPFSRVKMRVTSLRGCGLGGSQATMKAMATLAKTEADFMRFTQDPFALCSGFSGEPQPSGNDPLFDEELNSWAAPFLMHAINSKIVHRSNYLLGWPYGKDFVYDEMTSTGPGDEGKANIARSIETLSGFDWNGEASTKELKPGDGPDKEARDAGYYAISHYGIEDDEVINQVTVADDCDPGCGSTCKLVGESAMCLLQDEVAVGGGFWTPASAMGDKLYARLSANKTLSISIS